MMKSRLPWLLVVGALLSACGSSQRPTGPSTPPANTGYALSGTVYEASAAGARPVEGVEVTLHAWNEDALVPESIVDRTVTDASGRYRFVVQPKDWWIGAQKVGYEDLATRVLVRSDRVVDLELVRQ